MSPAAGDPGVHGAGAPPGIRPLDLRPTVRASVPGTLTVAGLLEHAAAVAPDGIAVRDPRGTRTFGALLADARAHAAVLPGSGPVLVLTQPGCHEVTAVLAAAVAGRPYVVLDPSAPSAASSAVCGRFPGATLLVDAATETAVAALGHDAAVARVDTDVPPTTSAAPVSVSPEDVAFVSWTSGTTGRPKGVAHGNRTVVRNGVRVRDGLGLRADDRVLALAPMAFVGGATPLYSSLAAGATLCVHVLSAEGPAGLHDFVAATDPTVVHLGPGRARLFAAEAARHGPRRGVRLVVVGGDRLDATHVQALATAFPDARVVQRYSLSETNWVTACEIVPAELEVTGDLPIGWPVPWLEVSADDATATVTGEDLALGYWDDPEGTAAAFVDGPRGRTFRTGDRLIEDAGGLLWFAGRADRATKVNGVRVDPVEIEGALEDVPGVTRAAVVAVALGGGPVRIAAFVVADDSVSSGAAVRRAVARTLPAAKLPALIELLPDLPVTARGKVDLADLADRAARAPEPGVPKPLGTAEEAVAAVVGSVLDRERVGRHDDVFALGADSLDTEEIAAALEPVLGRRLTPADLLAHPTVAELAPLVEGRDDPRAAPSLLIHVQRGSSTSVPVVLIPGGGGGSVETMAALGRRTGDRDVFVPVPRGYDRPARPDRTVEAMAATVVADLLAVTGGSRIVVAGHSSGGVVGFEVARQLRDRGVDVPTLVLIDAAAPERRSRASRREAREGELLLTHRSRLGRVYATLRARFRPRRWFRLRTAGVLARSGAVQQYTFGVLRGHAVERYRPPRYDGDVVILRAAGVDPQWAAAPSLAPTRDLGRWRAHLAREPRIIDVDGGHETVVLGSHRAGTGAVLAQIVAACDPPTPAGGG